jgi:hypothetical protein
LTEAAVLGPPQNKQAEAAEVRVDVVEEGLDELACLQRFLPATRPPQGQAAALAVSSCLWSSLLEGNKPCRPF